MGIGKNIKRILAEKNMTIKELHQESGIPLNTLYSITKRDSDGVSSSVLTSIAKVLNVSPFDLTIDVKQLHSDVKEYEIFIDYLKSLNFSVSVEPISDTETEIIVKNQTVTAVFTEDEFKKLQAQNKDAIIGMILLQEHKNKKEPSSAATDNGSEG